MSPLKVKHHEGRDLITVLSPRSNTSPGHTVSAQKIIDKEWLSGSKLINVTGPPPKKVKHTLLLFWTGKFCLRHPSWSLPWPLSGFTLGEKAKAQEKNKWGHRKENLSIWMNTKETMGVQSEEMAGTSKNKGLKTTVTKPTEKEEQVAHFNRSLSVQWENFFKYICIPA